MKVARTSRLGSISRRHTDFAPPYARSGVRQACQIKGSAAAAAKASFRKSAELQRLAYETTGVYPTLTVAAQSGKTTLKVAYLFSGIRRKASIAEALKKLCEDSGIALEFTEIDILAGGAAHDLFDKKKQDDFLQAVEGGEYHMCILSPSCGSWSRANWANKAGPQPCRNRNNPWGLPGQDAAQQRRADNGNEFVHFSIRVIRAAAAARARGFYSRSLLEHPEDLGRVPSGEPASIWQLEDIRTAHGNSRFSSVAGYQCQFPGCD